MLVKNKTLVIGAGFGGIASALRMKALGHDVTIIDRLNNIGGRAQVFKKGKYILKNLDFKDTPSLKTFK